MTPSETIIEAVATQDVELEAAGKKILVRQLTPIESFRFKKVIGKFADNLGYTTDAMLAASVRSVDGFPMPLPQNEAGIEFILEKLGESGWTVVQLHYAKIFGEATDKVETVKNS